MSNKRAPKWKKTGFQSDEEYRAACAATRKTKRAALAASEVENTAAYILQAMWDAADFHRPQVKITKEQLMAECRCSLKTVKLALKELRSEGSVKPFQGWEGGRGKATTWRLCVAGKAVTPSDDQIEHMEWQREREAAWNFLRGKYGPLKAMDIMGAPPQPLKGGESDTQRGENLEHKGGRNIPPPSQVPQEPPSPTCGQAEKDASLDAKRLAPSEPQTPEEWRQFSQLVETHGYDAALRLWNELRE